MTFSIAFAGKSGSGKTTLVKAFLKLIRKNFPSSSILLLDNDLTLELTDSFGIKTKNTIYGVKSGKHEYKTGIPEGMSKQEYIEWALEDIIVQIDDNINLISSWLITPKDCKCPATKYTRDALCKFCDRYDFVIFDCEYDLKYLNCLLDYPITETLIISGSKKEDIALSAKIAESSKKYALQGQLGIIINKAQKENLDFSIELINDLELNFLGYINYYDKINYDKIMGELELIYSRMNLPQLN